MLARNGGANRARRCLLSRYERTWLRRGRRSVYSPENEYGRSFPRYRLFASERPLSGWPGRLVRLSTRGYDRLRGEGWIPVPLPPASSWIVSHRIQSIVPKNSNKPDSF